MDNMSVAGGTMGQTALATDGFAGNVVVAEIFRLVSGSSSIPMTVQEAEVIGEMVIIDDATYAIVDNGVEMARIFGVYSIEPDELFGNRCLFVDGWIAPGQWGRWMVSK